MNIDDLRPAENALAEIRNAPHWYVRLTPPDARRRIDTPRGCLEAAQSCAVRFRGWDYPEASGVRQDGADNYPIAGGWEYYVHWEHHHEAWRLMQSGQFAHAQGLWEAAEGMDERRGVNTSGPFLSFESTVATCTEVLEFASRLSNLHDYTPSMGVRLDLHGTENRRITAGFNRLLFRDYVCREASISLHRDLPTEHDADVPNALAIDMAIDLFGIFGFDPQRDVLEEIQANFIARKMNW